MTNYLRNLQDERFGPAPKIPRTKWKSCKLHHCPVEKMTRRQQLEFWASYCRNMKLPQRDGCRSQFTIIERQPVNPNSNLMRVRVSSLFVRPDIEDLDPQAHPILINQYNCVIAEQERVLKMREQGAKEIMVKMVQTDCRGKPIPKDGRQDRGVDQFYSDEDVRRITGKWPGAFGGEMGYGSPDEDDR